MSSFVWPVLALIAAVFNCGFILTAQISKIPGQYLVVGSRILVLVTMCPIVFFIPCPEDIRFYLTVGLSGVIAGFADTHVMNVTRQYGGGVITRLLPLQIFIIFVMWLCIKPQLIQGYLETPLNTFAILMALGGCVYFSSHMRHCAVSSAALRSMLPALLGYASNFVLAKYAFEISDFHSGVYYYILVQTAALVPVMLISGIFNKGETFKLKKSIFFAKPTLKAAGFFYLFWMLHMVSKNYANTLTPNPAYVAALVLTAPVWMIILYKIIGIKEKADIRAGIGLMISAILLSLLNA